MKSIDELKASLQTDGGHILCLGAHCDDIDIGVGGTLLTWLRQWPNVTVTWVAFASNEQRANELETSASQFLANAKDYKVIAKTFRNGFFPAEVSDIKEYFEELKDLPDPALVFTHQRDDRHQDHRVINELTWNTFRNHCILEYEIPKYDGELPPPNVFVELEQEIVDKKANILMSSYESQLTKQWFDVELFSAQARLRGVECASRSRFAEAFIGRKICL